MTAGDMTRPRACRVARGRRWADDRLEHPPRHVPRGVHGCLLSRLSGHHGRMCG